MVGNECFFLINLSVLGGVNILLVVSDCVDIAGCGTECVNNDAKYVCG